MINRDNFYIKSKSDFEKSDKVPDREPDYESSKTIRVNDVYNYFDNPDYHIELDDDGDGLVYDEEREVEISITSLRDRNGNKYYLCGFPLSQYWYTSEGVYRKASHWGKVKECYWTLEKKEVSQEKMVTGFAPWESFIKND